ncbi:MAG: RNA methyltransferase [Anaerolineaceae bacterium]|nr:RNA methyltransferase [Anaerolineaceae bacterium]
MEIIRQCPSCRLRFPASQAFPSEFPCPHCGKPTQVASPTYQTPKVLVELGTPTGPAVEALLDNIRSAWNVGAMFRTADGAGLSRMHLCGVTSTPDNPKISKTALGAEFSVPWSFHPDGLQAACELKSLGYRLWGLEGGEEAISLFEAARALDNRPIALVVGNELSGIDPGILAECECVIAIPMQGFKRSLNVAIAFAIAAYTLRFHS